MAEKLLSLCEVTNTKNVAKVLLSTKFQTVINVLTDQISNGTEKAVILLRLIFQGLQDDNEYLLKKNKIIKEIFTLLNVEDISTKVASDVIGLVMFELDSTPVKQLSELLSFLVENIKAGLVTNGKSLELIPKTLSTLSSLSNIPVTREGTETLMTGMEFKRFIIHELCECQWSRSAVLLIAAMFRDIHLSEEELKKAITKIIRMFHIVSLQAVPSLTYQTLLLGSKGCRHDVLDGIVSFFCKKSKELQGDSEIACFLSDANEISNLRSVEGTVLLHIIFAMKQDQELGREFLKYLKNFGMVTPEKIFSPFSIALALSMTQIHRLEEQIYDFLKSFILQTFKDNEKRRKSKWIKDLFPREIPIEDSLLIASNNSKFGWDNMVHGLIQLAFILIGNYTLKPNDTFTITSEPTSPQQRASKLGSKIIQNVFANQEIAREDILQNILDNIVSKASGNVQHYLDLLTSVIVSVPQIVLDCITKFKEVFEYLSLLNVATAEGLLRAVLPLMKVSMSIKDSLLLILRKSMFSKQEETRKIAVTGFLLILRHFKINASGTSYSLNSQIALSQSFSCSQVNVGSQGRYNVAANESLCLEIIGNLHRSLTQHGNVRNQLYKGIYEVTCKNPKLSHAILDLLYEQFKIYYDRSEESVSPVLLGTCVTNINGDFEIVEPLAHLLSALLLCAKKSGRRLQNDEDEDEALSHLLDDVEDVFESLTVRIIKADLEDFGLDKTVEYGPSSTEGLKNSLRAQILIAIYEVLMEYNCIKSETISVENMELVSKLFEKHQKLHEVLKDKCKKSKSAITKLQLPCLFSFKCLTVMISSILSNTDAEAEPGLNVLRQSINFIKFLTVSVDNKLQQVVESRQCEGAGGNNLEHLFRQSLILAKSFLQHINGDCVLADEVLKNDKGKKLGNYCLDGLSLIMKFVCTHLPEQLKTLLNKLDFSPDVITQNDAVSDGSLVFRIIRRMQRLSIKLITSPDEDLGLKEAQTILGMLSSLIPYIESGNELQQVYAWFHRLAAEHAMDDILLTKVVLTSLLSLHHQCKTGSSTILKLAQDIHSQLGDMDEDIEVENRAHFSCITEKTAAPAAIILVLSHMEKILDEVDWTLSKLKFVPDEVEEHSDDGSAEEVSEREKIQIHISQMLTGVVLSLHELVQSAFPPGLSADTVTKVVTKLYATLGAFTKYYITLYTQKSGTIVPKYERLVKLTGSHLAQQVYAMITFVQSSQSQNLQEQTMNGKVKDKKKANITGKNRALKESRSIPNLIYAIEQFERYLIQLSKKSKIDFMENMKRSTSRDFRINTASLEAALQELSEGEEEVVDEENMSSIHTTTTTQNETNTTKEVLDLTKDDAPPPKKRTKLSTGKKPLRSSYLRC